MHTTVPDDANAAAVAEAHLADRRIQDTYDTRYINDGFDADRRRTFCLVEAPDEATAHAGTRKHTGWSPTSKADHVDVRFQLPTRLHFNTERVEDPTSYARATRCASWLYLNGPEFAEMDGGMSFDDVRAAVPAARNVISDPPRILDLDLARQHVEALDGLPRPTLVTCRAGPRASAVVYMYAGLRTGASPMDVVAAARRDGAPCAEFPSYLDWIASSIAALRRERTDLVTRPSSGEVQA